VLLLLAVFSSQPFLFLYAGILLIYVQHVCWRINETKHLFVNILLYWSVVAVLIPYADIVDKPLQQLYVYGKSDIVLASWIGLTALAVYLTCIQAPFFRV